MSRMDQLKGLLGQRGCMFNRVKNENEFLEVGADEIGVGQEGIELEDGVVVDGGGCGGGKDVGDCKNLGGGGALRAASGGGREEFQ